MSELGWGHADFGVADGFFVVTDGVEVDVLEGDGFSEVGFEVAFEDVEVDSFGEGFAFVDGGGARWGEVFVDEAAIEVEGF